MWNGAVVMKFGLKNEPQNTHSSNIMSQVSRLFIYTGVLTNKYEV